MTKKKKKKNECLAEPIRSVQLYSFSTSFSSLPFSGEMDPAFTAEASGSMYPPPPPEKDESSSSAAASTTTAAREAEDTAATAVALATSNGDAGGGGVASAAPKKKPRTWKDELIEPECQFCRDTRAALMGLVKGTAGAAGGAADRGIDAATGLAGSVRKGSRAARERVERFVSTGVAHATDAEERAFEALKGRSGMGEREEGERVEKEGVRASVASIAGRCLTVNFQNPSTSTSS